MLSPLYLGKLPFVLSPLYLGKLPFVLDRCLNAGTTLMSLVLFSRSTARRNCVVVPLMMRVRKTTPPVRNMN